MRRALVLLAVLAACKTSEKKAGTPAGPDAAASCDYVSKTVGENHSCQEVYAESQVDALEAWCNKLQGPRDKGTFSKTACPIDGRNGGCLFPNGSVKWKYKGDVSCIGGLEFKDAPPRKESTPYRCANDRLCTETQSVFDLTKTVTAQNCETGGPSKFSAGSCSTENVVARCAVHRQDEDTTWFFYAPVTMEAAEATCKDVEGQLTAAAASGSGEGIAPSSGEGITPPEGGAGSGSGSGSTEQSPGSTEQSPGSAAK